MNEECLRDGGPIVQAREGAGARRDTLARALELDVLRGAFGVDGHGVELVRLQAANHGVSVAIQTRAAVAVDSRTRRARRVDDGICLAQVLRESQTVAMRDKRPCGGERILRCTSRASYADTIGAGIRAIGETGASAVGGTATGALRPVAGQVVREITRAIDRAVHRRLRRGGATHVTVVA